MRNRALLIKFHFPPRAASSVRRAFVLDAKQHLSWRGRYPDAFALPDRWATWALGAIPTGLSLIRARRPAVIRSTFPITAAHLISLALHRLSGMPVLFAYPNGKVGKDFTGRHVDMVRAAGFQAAFTSAIGALTRRDDRYQLPRSRPWDRTPFRFGLRLLQWLARG